VCKKQSKRLKLCSFPYVEIKGGGSNFGAGGICSLEQAMSVSSVCPRGRNEPKLTCMNQEKGRSLGQFAQQTCKVAEVEAVGFNSPPTWVGRCPHSCPFLVMGLESLQWGPSDERRASTPWGEVVCFACVAHDDALEYRRRFVRGLVHKLPEVMIVTSGVTKGPSVTILANCSRICSKILSILSRIRRLNSLQY
jgi:ribosomal protein L34E